MSSSFITRSQMTKHTASGFYRVKTKLGKRQIIEVVNDAGGVKKYHVFPYYRTINKCTKKTEK